MLPPPLSLKITYLGAFWTLFQLKSLHKLSSSKPFGVGTWGTAYWFICWHKVSMKSVTQSKWILCIYKLIKYGICMWKTLFFQPRDNAWCGCGFAFCLENPEIAEHGSPWAGNLEPAPSFWNLKFSVCQRRNEGSGLISEAWQWEFRLPLKFGLRLTSDAVEVLPATWQQLVATGREETRSMRTKVQSGTVWAKVGFLLLGGRAWRWSRNKEAASRMKR